VSRPATELSVVPFGAVALAPSTFRPKNYARSLFHVASGGFALALLLLLPTRGWLITTSASFAAAAWTLEILRRKSPGLNDRLMRLFGAIAHPQERHRVNSATWYMTALVLLSVFASMRAAAIGVVVLAVADPAAAFIGRRYGRTRLRANRSLEGTLSFFVAGTLAAVALLSVFYVVPWPARVALAMAGAMLGALAELFLSRLDDNFTIPLTAALAATLAQSILPVL